MRNFFLLYSNKRLYMTYSNSEKQTDTEFIVPRRISLYWGTISQWISMAVTIGLGLAVTPIIIRRLGNESYGLWGLVASFVGFYGLFDLGLSQAVSRFLGNAIGAKDIEEFNRVASTGKCLFFCASLLVMLVAVMMIEPAQSILSIPVEYAKQFGVLILLSATSVTISLVMAVYGGALLASEDFVPLSCIRTGGAVIRSLGSLLVILAGKGVVGLAVVSVASGVLEQVIIFLRCRKRLPQMRASFFAFETKVARALVGFATASFVVIIAEVLRSKLDVMLVTRFGGLGQAGLYAVALVIFRYFFRAMAAVFRVAWARLNNLHGNGDMAELQVFFLRASHMAAVCAALVSGFLIGLAPWLIHLWLGDGYGESAIVLRILIGGYFLEFATNPGRGSLFATARHRYYAAQTAVEAVASFTLAFILGSKFGMNGVALGIVVPIVVVKLTIQPWYVARNLSIELTGYWFRVVAMATLAMVVLAGGLASVSYSFDRWGLRMTSLITISSILISGTVLWQLVLDKMDRVHIVFRGKQAVRGLGDKISKISCL